MSYDPEGHVEPAAPVAQYSPEAAAQPIEPTPAASRFSEHLASQPLQAVTVVDVPPKQLRQHTRPDGAAKPVAKRVRLIDLVPLQTRSSAVGKPAHGPLELIVHRYSISAADHVESWPENVPLWQVQILHESYQRTSKR